MRFTDEKYIDTKGGLFLEYFGENGFYNYIHIDKYGRIEFLGHEVNKCDGAKCTYYLDYCSSEALTAMHNLETLANSLKSDLDYYKRETERLSKNNANNENDETGTNIENSNNHANADFSQFCADDIPF